MKRTRALEKTRLQRKNRSFRARWYQIISAKQLGPGATEDYYFNPDGKPEAGDEILIWEGGKLKVVRYTGLERSHGVRMTPEEVAEVHAYNLETSKKYLAALGRR